MENNKNKNNNNNICPLHQKGKEMPDDVLKSALFSVKKTSKKSNNWMKQI